MISSAINHCQSNKMVSISELSEDKYCIYTNMYKITTQKQLVRLEQQPTREIEAMYDQISADMSDHS